MKGVATVMQKRPFVGVGVIVMDGGSVLLGKRKTGHGVGGWQFPGGHLEYGESIEACAEREVWEETGIRIENIRFGPYTNDIFAKNGKHYVTLFVVAKKGLGLVEAKEPDKCEKWEWFEWGRFPEPLFLPTRNLLTLGFNPFRAISSDHPPSSVSENRVGFHTEKNG